MAQAAKKSPRWHIAVFLAPAVLIYTAIMIIPLFSTLKLAMYSDVENSQVFVGLQNFRALFGDPQWSDQFWNALKNNTWFFIVHMIVQNPIGILLAALLSSPRLRMRSFYRTAIFIPTILSFVIAGFAWKLILSPLWGVAPNLLDLVGLKSLFQPWLGKEAYALTTLALISVWQFVGIPMMLIYAALLSIPDELLEAAECDGITGMSQFWKVKLPLILPAIGIISILTFVGNFNAFDLIYATQGALAGPDFSTDILGTFMFRTFFGFQLQLGDPNLGAAIATAMFAIILVGVSIYLFGIQTRLRRYQF
ncbi:sugar ABC transporter permease [Nitratireductor sp. GISD-1A_MAKvit]|uniref:carbohydrate ABC transporter permease n=1 Tax=Nitratireductor sp. GISD-1A_MAKvit TaxID=3234198 RepID=UPI00346710D2